MVWLRLKHYFRDAPEFSSTHSVCRLCQVQVTFKLLATQCPKFTVCRLRMKSLSVTIQMKATEQYFPVVLLIILHKVILTFESVDGTCDH